MRIQPHRPQSRAGFTLMELVVALTIIALMTAVVTPMFHGSLTWVHGDRATRDFVAAMKYAQERAVSDEVEYRFYVDDDTGAFWLMRFDHFEDDDKVFGFLAGTEGQRRILPETCEITKCEARKDSELGARFVAFYPHGACDYATIKLETANGTKLRIETKGRLGRLDVDEQ